MRDRNGLKTKRAGRVSKLVRNVSKVKESSTTQKQTQNKQTVCACFVLVSYYFGLCCKTQKILKTKQTCVCFSPTILKNDLQTKTLFHFFLFENIFPGCGRVREK